MTQAESKKARRLRIVTQGIFFSVFVYIFLRSLDPFSTAVNPFLRYDPLVLFTHRNYNLSITLPIAGIIILTILLGRYFCGWICPLGTLVDILDYGLKPLRALNPISMKTDTLKARLGRIPPSWPLLGITAVTLFFTPPLLQFLHPNVWIIRIFSLSALGISFLGLLAIFSALSRRFWCTTLCPLGALYGLIATISPFKLSIVECTRCGRCNTCPMGAALFETKTVLAHQCTLCFNFEHRCPVEGFSFGFEAVKQRSPASTLKYQGVRDESRRRFLGQSALLVFGLAIGGGISLTNKRIRTHLIRPPGVEDETRFVKQCLRCFQCVRSCPNQIIGITGLEAGFDSIFTPHLSFAAYGCDYYCQVCQLVCPNFAIPLQTLEEKQRARIGLAFIDERRCIVFTEDTNCLVCEEFCPIPEKAIKVYKRMKTVHGQSMLLRYPVVASSLCTGCGICEAHCPIESEKAIKIRKV